MGITVELSDSLTNRLHAVSRPFEDTPATAIERILSFYEREHRRTNQSSAQIGPSRPGQRRFDPSNPPHLTHARLVAARLAGDALRKPKWNELVREVHRRAFLSLGDVNEVRRLSTANLFVGEKDDEGFRPLDTLGFSIQGVDSNDSWRISYDLARKLVIPIEVEFEWRHKDDAAYPGEAGILEWTPPSPT